MKVHEALLEVMRSVPSVKKEDRNTQQNFNFRGIDATLNAVGPQLRKHGVIVSPRLMGHNAENVTVGRNNTPMRSVTLLVEYTFIGPEGDRLSALVPGEAMDSGDKAYSKAMSVAFRTALLQTLALPTDEPDPDSQAYERNAKAITEADLARTELLAKVKKLKMDPGDVAQLYLSEVGKNIQEETDPAKIREFAEKLGTKK